MAKVFLIRRQLLQKPASAWPVQGEDFLGRPAVSGGMRAGAADNKDLSITEFGVCMDSVLVHVICKLPQVSLPSS